MSNHPPVAPDWIRGITIRQPWTTCILTGAKTIENRPRPWFMSSLSGECSI